MIKKVYEQIIVLFILMAVGYGLGKIRFIKEEETNTLSKMTTKVAIPCFLMSTMFIEANLTRYKMILETLIVSLLVYMMIIPLSYWVGSIAGKTQEAKEVFIFACMFANSGFNGFPIIENMYGEDALLCGNVFNVVINLAIFTVGIQVFNKNTSPKEKIKKCLNPGLIGGIGGIILFLLRIRLPQIVETSIRYVGNMCIPLSMFTVGVLLCDVPIKKTLKNIRMYSVVIFRLLGVPLLMFFILQWGVKTKANWISIVLPIMLGMPSAMVTALFAKEYGSDYKSACQIILLSTLYSCITIPLLLCIMEWCLKM